jgi:peptidoglycan/xylan/chitin deacetylase (PgdA/CDA1 family)
MPPARVMLYAASAAVLVLVARAALVRPPPLAVACALLVAYVTLMLAGVLVLRLRMYVDAVVQGPPGARGVVLTFDDGPDPASTLRVLEALDAARAKATFFVVARKAEEHPEIIRDIIRRGHAVGLHSYAHDRLFALRSTASVREDLQRGLRVLEGLVGQRPTLFRPPVGHTNPSIARAVDDLDLLVVGWSVSGRDGVSAADPGRVLARVRHGLRDGAIVLLHDAAERGGRIPAGVSVLPDVLDAIQNARLEVVPLSTWIGQGA